MQLDPCLAAKVLLLQLELRRQVEQSSFFFSSESLHQETLGDRGKRQCSARR